MAREWENQNKVARRGLPFKAATVECNRYRRGMGMRQSVVARPIREQRQPINVRARKLIPVYKVIPGRVRAESEA